MERIQLLMGRLMTVKLADLRGEDGQGVTEYGIVLAFVAVALAAVLVVLGTGITGFINKIVTDIGKLG
jgi:Flp pilus assembly pilin Flp